MVLVLEQTNQCNGAVSISLEIIFFGNSKLFPNMLWILRYDKEAFQTHGLGEKTGFSVNVVRTTGLVF